MILCQHHPVNWFSTLVEARSQGVALGAYKWKIRGYMRTSNIGPSEDAAADHERYNLPTEPPIPHWQTVMMGRLKDSLNNTNKSLTLHQGKNGQPIVNRARRFPEADIKSDQTSWWWHLNSTEEEQWTTANKNHIWPRKAERPKNSSRQWSGRNLYLFELLMLMTQT